MLFNENSDYFVCLLVLKICLFRGVGGAGGYKREKMKMLGYLFILFYVHKDRQYFIKMFFLIVSLTLIHTTS